MLLIVKHFQKLSLEDHVWLSDKEGIQAYLCVLPPGISFQEASIDRVVSSRHRQGLATQLLREGIRVAKEHFHAEKNNH